MWNRTAVLTLWQLLDTATDRVEPEGRIDGVAATDTSTGREEQAGRIDGMAATWYGC